MEKHDELPTAHKDPLVAFLNKTIKVAIKILAILMVLVIFWGIADVMLVLYEKLLRPPLFLLELSDILKVFAAFLVVLIAIEVYQNIILYLRTDVLPVKLVVGTALMAISRKVIIMDFEDITPMYVLSTGAVVLALGITYFLLGRKDNESHKI